MLFKLFLFQVQYYLFYFLRLQVKTFRHSDVILLKQPLQHNLSFSEEDRLLILFTSESELQWKTLSYGIS